MEETESQKSRTNRFGNYLAVTLFVFVAVPLGIASIARFLPSPEWVAVTSVASHVFGAILVALVIWRVFVSTRPQVQDARNGAGIFFMLLLVYGAGYDFVVKTVPMALSAFAGKAIEIEFTIEQVTVDAPTRCGNSLRFEGLPFLFDKICQLPENVVVALKPGTRVLLVGYGTKYGLFPKGLRKVD